MLETDRTSAIPTSEIFRKYLGELRQTDPQKAERLWSEFKFCLGKIAINQGKELLEVVAKDIDNRIASGSINPSYTPESFVAFLFTPDHEKNEVIVLDVMRRFISTQDS